MDPACVTGFSALGAAIVGMAGYIVLLWKNHAAELQKLNDEQKDLLRHMLEELTHE